MVWVEAVIYVTPKVFVTMKPRANADEDPASKPFRAVVAVRSAGVRRDVIVTVRTHRGRSNANGDLSVHFRRCHGQENSSHRCQSEIFQWIHNCPRNLKGHRTVPKSAGSVIRDLDRVPAPSEH
jgi:hypothetical protein